MTNTQIPGDDSKINGGNGPVKKPAGSKFSNEKSKEIFFKNFLSKNQSITLEEIQEFERLYEKSRGDEQLTDKEKIDFNSIQPRYGVYIAELRQYEEYADLKNLGKEVELAGADKERFEALNSIYGQLESQETDTSFPSKAHIGEFKDSEIEVMKKLFAAGLKKLGDDDAKRLYELMDTYPAEARQMSETAEMKDLIAKMDSGNALSADEAERFAELSKIYSGATAQADEKLSNAADLAELKTFIETGTDDLVAEQSGRFIYLSNAYPVESRQMKQDAEKAEFLTMLENGTESLTKTEMNRLNELTENYPQVYEDFLNSQYEPQVNVTGVNNGTTATNESSSTSVIGADNAAAPAYTEDQIKDLNGFAALLKKMDSGESLTDDEIERYLTLSTTYDADEARKFAAEQESAPNSSEFLHSLLTDDETIDASKPGNEDSELVPADDGASKLVSEDTLNKAGVTIDDVKATGGYPWNAVGNQPEDMTLKKFLDDNFDSQAVEI
ncbi:MAG TPA: hypothetical protein PLO51_04010, partial [Candidatus Micrarchaeota archaeon]|nr:hypothetical protein [Candidatus Micrarchaeota archaeon]